MNRLAKKTKYWLWPHAENDFKPALIRVKSLSIITAAVIIFGVASNLAQTGQFKVLSYATDITTGSLLVETNQERSAGGLASLGLNSHLNTAAQNKANHMISNDYWAHVAPDGTTPWSFIDTTGYVYIKAGENLAYGFLTSSGTVEGWMDSPGHRANILDSGFSEVGFGIKNGSNYQGGEFTVVVAMYASAYQTAEPIVIQKELTIPTEPPATLQEIEEVNTDSVIEDVVNTDQPLQVTRDPQNFPAIVISGPVLSEGVTGRVVTNFEALISGSAPISMYLTMSLLLAVGAVYAMRHVRMVHQFIKVGEHTLEGHPLLEASVVYALIWLVLSATFGVIL